MENESKNKLASLVAKGEISVEELANANELITRAKFILKGVDACKKNLLFPLGCTIIECYSYQDSAGEYQAWGKCTQDGIFTCFSNWGGNHQIGEVNLTSFEDVFLAFENNEEFRKNLTIFLQMQIDKT